MKSSLAQLTTVASLTEDQRDFLDRAISQAQLEARKDALENAPVFNWRGINREKVRQGFPKLRLGVKMAIPTSVLSVYLAIAWDIPWLWLWSGRIGGVLGAAAAIVCAVVAAGDVFFWIIDDYARGPISSRLDRWFPKDSP